MVEGNWGQEPKDNTVPIEEVFTHKEIERMKFEKWRLNQHPEDHSVPSRNREDWQKFRRREQLKQLMRK